MFKRKKSNKEFFYNALQKYVKEQKNYEILAFMENNTVKSKHFANCLFTYLYEIFIHFKDHGNNEPIQIFSVKRLHDGEIFTIGDIVEFGNEYGPITSFYIFGPSLVVGCYMSGSHWLDEIRKKKIKSYEKIILCKKEKRL